MDIQNTNYEHILLNTLLTDNKAFTKIMPILSQKYFINPANQRIFKEIKNFYDSYNTIPGYVEIISKIKEIPDSNIRGKIAEHLGLVSKVEPQKSTEASLDSAIKFVRDAIFTEAILTGSDGIQNKQEEDLLKSWELMESAFRVSIDTDLGLDYDDIEKRIEYYQTALYGLLPEGFIELNKRLGQGFLGGTLSVILSSSGIGKSLFCTALISAFIKDNKNVLLVSMEMSAFEIVKRVDANVLDIPINTLSQLSVECVDSDFNTISMKDRIREAFTKAKAKGLGNFYTKAYAPGTFSAMMLDDLLNTYETERNIKFDIVFLDYLGIMKSDRLPFSVGPYNYVKSIAEEVRAIAVKRDLPIISPSQLNRSGINSLDADNSAVADSIGTVQTADFLCFMLQTEELKKQNKIHFKITKNRFNGRTDTFIMDIDYKLMRFSDSVESLSMESEAIAKVELDSLIQEHELKALETNKNSLDSWDVIFDDILKS